LGFFNKLLKIEKINHYFVSTNTNHARTTILARMKRTSSEIKMNMTPVESTMFKVLMGIFIAMVFLVMLEVLNKHLV